MEDIKTFVIDALTPDTSGAAEVVGMTRILLGLLATFIVVAAISAVMLAGLRAAVQSARDKGVVEVCTTTYPPPGSDGLGPSTVCERKR